MANLLSVYCNYVQILVVFIVVRHTFAQYYIPYQSPNDCRTGTTDSVHQFFDISQLRCTDCAQPKEFQTVSPDGLLCVCQQGMRLVEDFGGGTIDCSPCPANMVTSSDGWSCIECGPNTQYNPVTGECEACSNVEAAVERELDGAWPNPSTPSRQCASCTAQTHPDASGTQCVRCSQILSMISTATDCVCPELQMVGGVCFADPADIVDDNSQLSKVQFGSSLEVDSAYFMENVRAADGMCKPKYSNLTACQVLGNLCVLLMYNREFQSTNVIQDACAAYLAIAQVEQAQWPANMPWLYYEADPAPQILTDTRITTQYKFPSMQLKFYVAEYALNGSFLGMKPVTGGVLQLCKDSNKILDAAYNFGTRYVQTCELSARDLFDNNKYPLTFFDLYLEYPSETNGDPLLYAVPVLLRNYVNQNGGRPNTDSQNSNWELVRRFFLVDNVSGKLAGSADTEDAQVLPQAVRYLKSATIHIELQSEEQDGKIYPPYFELEYAVVTQDDYNNDRNMSVDFGVTYMMNLGKFNGQVVISSAILCVLSVLLAGVQTWAWSKRCGKMHIDFLSLLKFAMYSLNCLANIFFIIALGTSCWWIVFYKRQTTVFLLLPTHDQEKTFRSYIGTAFALKAIHVLHMIIEQVRVDIFFVDWERPRGKVVHSGDAKEKAQTEAPVSIWRTYFVANEWNELQTVRKINDAVQVFTVLFFLEVVGFANVSTADPKSDFSPQPDEYYAPHSRTFRFAVSCFVYIMVGVVQYIFFTFIYERFIEDKVRQYVDLCSMSNVSVFVLSHAQFGYYIHGRSVHGRADTDMREMSENMKREEEDLCGQRGLLPNTENQTFQIAVPRRLRQQYDRVMAPIFAPQQGAQIRGTGPGSQLDAQTEKVLDGYKSLNRFLQAFIDHALRDVDYIIKDKLLFENILDVEFQDGSERGFFYNDDGHSFDAVLFYGSEVTLFIFEMLLFTVLDFMGGNFVLSGVLTYIIMQLLCMLRASLGQANLAKKTLVDKRFLI